MYLESLSLTNSNHIQQIWSHFDVINVHNFILHGWMVFGVAHGRETHLKSIQDRAIGMYFCWTGTGSYGIDHIKGQRLVTMTAPTAAALLDYNKLREQLISWTQLYEFIHSLLWRHCGEVEVSLKIHVLLSLLCIQPAVIYHSWSKKWGNAHISVTSWPKCEGTRSPSLARFSSTYNWSDMTHMADNKLW